MTYRVEPPDHRLVHGHAKRGSVTAEYQTWNRMIARCECETYTDFHRYGGRGIKVCAAWRESYAQFLSDMGPRPSSGHSLDRIDVDGDYAPGNCRWATKAEQARNTSRTVFVEYEGERLCLKDAAARAGISINTMKQRRRQGWQGADLLRPVRVWGR